MDRITNGEGNNSLRDNWVTPDTIFNKLNNQYSFNFDCCASFKNKKCESFSSDFETVSVIEKTAWMNPPFSKARTMFEHFFKVVNAGVAIYRCDNMETELWQDTILPNVSWVFVFKGRINYIGDKKTGARFPSALIGINVLPPINLEGTVFKNKIRIKT